MLRIRQCCIYACGMAAIVNGQNENSGEPKPDLKFVGGRFDGEGFPLDGLPELYKYQRLVLEVAKQVWVEQNPGKKLPSDIADQVRLRLLEVKKGSQKTFFAPEREAFPGIPTLRELALDTTYALFDEIIKNNFGVLAQATPGVVTAVRGIGSGFGEDEAVAVRPERPDEVRFGPSHHRALLAGLRGLRFERSGTLVGILHSLDATNKFSLVDGQGRTINGKFSERPVWAALHTLHNQQGEADLIWLDCDYLISENDGTVVRINEVREANLFGKSSDPWAIRLAKFAALPEGHAGGEGERTEVFAVQAALEVLTAISESGWEEPAIFADLDGGVRMEWLFEGQHLVITVDNDAQFYGFFLNGSTDEEASEEPAGVAAALEFIERFVA